MEKFELKGDFIELIKLLKAVGVAGTGGEAKMLVEEELVVVNSEIEVRKRRKLIVGDVVVIDNQSFKVV